MPIVPAPYAEEVWTGLEYASSAHMIQRGLVKQGLSIVEAARDRYDGRRRNPFNDIECGSYYARSLSAWALVNAWSGLKADLEQGELAFDPAMDGDQVLVWSAGNAWGQLTISGMTVRLSVLGGTISLRSLRVGSASCSFAVELKLETGQEVELDLADDKSVETAR